MSTEDRAKAIGKNVEGKVQEVFGNITGNKKDQVEVDILPGVNARGFQLQTAIAGLACLTSPKLTVNAPTA